MNIRIKRMIYSTVTPPTRYNTNCLFGCYQMPLIIILVLGEFHNYNTLIMMKYTVCLTSKTVKQI